VRTRIDWKYLLCLEVTDVGFHPSVPSEFRSRLLAHKAECRLFEAILSAARRHAWLKSGGWQRSDSTHMLGQASAEAAGNAYRDPTPRPQHPRARAAPEGLRSQTSSEWVERYGLRVSE